MKICIPFIIILVSLFFFPYLNFGQNPADTKVTGKWIGTIELPNIKLEMIFEISKDENGKLISTLAVPLQSAKNIPVNKTIVSNDSLKLTVETILGEFSGKFDNDSVAVGTWFQRGAKFPLTLKKGEAGSVLIRPQTPQPPYPYLSEDVEYINQESGLKLAGTLTLPEKAKNCPAVILITGSGAQDRDESIYGHRPFLVIADYLTRNGIAVLRVDDRGVGGSEGNTRIATSEDFAGDVLAGIAFLKTRKKIAPSEIGLIGHSEGGIIAPIVATRSNEVSFIILLSGPGISGDKILLKQSELSIKAAGMNEEMVERNQKIQETIFDIILNEKDSIKRLDRLQRTLTNGVYPMMDEDRKKIVDEQIKEVNNPWFRFFLSYNPALTLSKVKCPVLALNGSKDSQVVADENLSAIKNALTEGGNKNFKTMELENLNHFFQHATTGSLTEYGQIEETVSPEVLEIMKDWILKITSH